MQIRVERDPDTGVTVIFDANGEEVMELDELHAHEASSLYVALAKAHGWIYERFCPHCNTVMLEGECPECDGFRRPN